MKKICMFIFTLVLALCIPFNVNAEKRDPNKLVCDVDTLGGGAIEKTFIFDWPDVFSRTANYFYTASIGDKVAFCVNPGLARGNTYTFYKSLNDYAKSPEAARLMASAYNYYMKNEGNMEIREIAQLMVWIANVNPNIGANLVTQFNMGIYYNYNTDTCLGARGEVSCDEIPAVVGATKAFVAMGLLQQTDVTCHADLVKTYKKDQGKNWEYFSCDTYTRVMTAAASNDFLGYFIDNYGYPGTDRALGVKLTTVNPKVDCAAYPANAAFLPADKAKICKAYKDGTNLTVNNYFDYVDMLYTLKTMSGSEYTDLLNKAAGNSGQAGADNTAFDYLIGIIKTKMEVHLSAIVSGAANADTSLFEIWCADSDADGVPDGVGFKQCFLTKKVKKCNSCNKDLNEALQACKDRGLSVAQCVTSGGLDQVANDYPEYRNYILNPNNPKCGGDDNGGKKKCVEVLPEARRRGLTLDQFRDLITYSDEEKAKATVNANGILDCEDIVCDPVVKLDSARCGRKDDAKPWFNLKDASTDQEPNLACIERNTAYKIDEDRIASKDNNLSSSKYCDVYCWESLYATMPNEPAPDGYVYNGYIPTGRLFFWGTDLGKKEFANFQVKRICWAKDINYDQYKSDWYANEDAIAQEYANYLARKAYNEDTNDDHVKVSDDKCCTGTRTTTAGETKCGMSAAQCQQYIGAVNGCWQQPEGSGNWCGTKPGEDSCSGSWGKKYKKDSEVTKTVQSASGNTKTGKSGTAESGCTTSKPSAASLTVSNSTDTLKGYISNRNSLRNSIRACQSTLTVNANTIYKHTAIIELIDNFNLGLCDTRGVCGEELKLTRNIENQSIETNRTPNGSFTTGCTDVGEFNSGNPCAEDGGTVIPTYPNKEFEWVYSAIESFVYGDKFHFYAQADTDFVANREYHDENFDYGVAVANGLIYDMGIGIPSFFIRYSGHFDITVKMNSLGNDGHFDKVATKGKTKYGYDLTNYACPYDLAKILPDYCPPSDPNYPCDGITKDGISLIYRIIEMGAGDQKKIFPGNSGNGRNPGSNWATFISSNFDKFKNITTTSKIYGRKPLYSIELSPTLIGEIRRDNNNYRGNNMDPYTSYKNVNGKYKITCEGDNDKTCTSDYISELISKGKITGLLADATPSQRRNLIKKYKATGSVI